VILADDEEDTGFGTEAPDLFRDRCLAAGIEGVAKDDQVKALLLQAAGELRCLAAGELSPDLLHQPRARGENVTIFTDQKNRFHSVPIHASPHYGL
jgi:hypothetical protein